MLFATLAVILGVVSAVTRYVETYRSSTVTGISGGYAWMALVANGLWFAYGLRLGVPAQVWVSVAWGLAFLYILWRLADRQVTLRFAVGVLFAVGAGMGLAFGLSGNVAGWVGGCLIIAGTTPQVLKVWRTRDAAGVAPWAWFGTLVMCVCWVVYGLGEGLVPVYATNAVVGALCLAVLAGVWRTHGHTQKVSEAPERALEAA